MLSLGLVAAPVQYRKKSNAFHQTGSRVAQESTPGLERSVDSDVVMGRHVEVTRLGRVMRGLLGDVVGALVVFQVPVAGEDFAQNRIQRLLDSPSARLARCTSFCRNGHVRGPDVPAAQVKLDDGYESLGGIVDGGNVQEHLGMTHEAANRSARLPNQQSTTSCRCILCYPLQHASGLENKGGQDDAAEVRAGAQLGDDVQEDCSAGEPDGSFPCCNSSMVLLLLSPVLQGAMPVKQSSSSRAS